METDEKPNLIAQATEIVAAYVTNNSVPGTELPALIASVHAALQGLGTPIEPVAEPLVPAVSIKKSITSDYLISLEDGKRFRTLKRHLSGRGMTPQEYRTKWGLPHDYPMVAPSYAETRSRLAKEAGLGQQRKKTPTAEKAPVKVAAKGKSRGAAKKAA